MLYIQHELLPEAQFAFASRYFLEKDRSIICIPVKIRGTAGWKVLCAEGAREERKKTASPAKQVIFPSSTNQILYTAGGWPSDNHNEEKGFLSEGTLQLPEQDGFCCC